MSYIAPTAQVGPNAEVGDDARVGDNAWVGDDAEVGDNAWIGNSARVGGNALVGGNSWVADHSQVGGNAQVGGNSRIGGYADVQSTHHYLTIGPIGTERRYVTISRQRPTDGRWGHQIVAGCWSGTCDELAARIADPDTAWPGAGPSDADRLTARREYEAALVLMRARVATWEAEPVTDEDIARWVDLQYANLRYADLTREVIQ